MCNYILLFFSFVVLGTFYSILKVLLKLITTTLYYDRTILMRLRYENTVWWFWLSSQTLWSLWKTKMESDYLKNWEIKRSRQRFFNPLRHTDITNVWYIYGYSHFSSSGISCLFTIYSPQIGTNKVNNKWFL